jgi:biopolymer transport protein TolR
VAGGSVYQDDEPGAAITDINVTPFVDVVLVLLIIFMVTAKLIVARGVEVDKPKAATGGAVETGLRLSVDKEGHVFVNGTRFDEDEPAITEIKKVIVASGKSKAVIAGDVKAAYGGVMRAIDLAKRAGAEGIALENVAPSTK